MAFVYLITNTGNGKYYVGVTGQTLAQRWLGHLGDRNDRRYLSNAILKYGPESFVMEPLCEVHTLAQALSLETLWITILGSHKQQIGYNLTFGGEENMPTDRVREVHSANMTRRWENPEWRAHMHTRKTGSKHTEESKQKIGAALKICHQDPDFSKKRFTPEARAKISESNRRRASQA